MECGGLVGDSLSPESTVTSLLSSSGHLRSSLRPPDHITSFRYRDKVHSASTVCMKVIFLHQLLFLTILMFILFLLIVLMESLTERELDFLDLPVSSLHHAGNRDRLSMTTDELLSIPYDGSMPVTHTSTPDCVCVCVCACVRVLSGNKIESLIQKADQVLNSLSLSCDGVDYPAASVFCLSQTLDCGPHGNSIWKQPGPVEALKQMLFRLQAVEGKLQGQQALTDGLQTEETPVKFLMIVSILRALHHLSCLKLLVEEPREKHRQEEEKDEDEGRYSSSSADGPTCTQQKRS
uniref:Uncharacterized protein n=1 Tax=Seriola lalandi dorsalis TaxID=1841481 RepID=A0A3B4Y008_SERLL